MEMLSKDYQYNVTFNFELLSSLQQAENRVLSEALGLSPSIPEPPKRNSVFFLSIDFFSEWSEQAADAHFRR